VSSALHAAKKIVFLGTPAVAGTSLELLIAASKKGGFEISAVVTQPPAPAGRKKKLTPSPVHVITENHEITLYTPEKVGDAEFLKQLQSLEPDLCITAAYGQYLPKRFLSIPKLGTLNIHPSLLPHYRGAAPVQRCLEAGDDVTGVTILFTVKKMDAGPIVKQVKRPLNGNENAQQILDEMFVQGTNLLLDALPDVFDGRIAFATGANCTPQDDALATEAPKLSAEDSYVDFESSPAATIHNKCRAYAIWPGLWTTVTIGNDLDDVKRIKIISTEILDAQPDLTRVTADITLTKMNKKPYLRVVCGDGSVIGIKEVQPAGKKVMDAGSFFNGLRGSTLVRVSS
jgi:methionyl-tRNA formyltransferase